MKILVLDTIHGGKTIAGYLTALGHTCDTVDVYRHESGITEEEAVRNLTLKRYDLVCAPIHLSPEYCILKSAAAEGIPVRSHHEISSMIVSESVKCESVKSESYESKLTDTGNDTGNPKPVIEITGTRGKTTTAYAISHMLSHAAAISAIPPEKTPDFENSQKILETESGILHTSRETVTVPNGRVLQRVSITPASSIMPALYALKNNLWFVAEESLGVCGFGNLAVLTSTEDYPCADKKRSALAVKLASMAGCGRVLIGYGADKSKVLETVESLPPSRRIPRERLFFAYDVVGVDDGTCRYDSGGFSNREASEKIAGSFSNPLLCLEGYKQAIATAAAAACLLGYNPDSLSGFSSVPGRLSLTRENGITIIDNSNSGTNRNTSLIAAEYARKTDNTHSGIILVIGIESETVCEGFSKEDVTSAIAGIKPECAVVVGDSLKGIVTDDFDNTIIYHADNLESGRKRALEIAGVSDNEDKQGERGGKTVILCVKTWR
ncbi:MAG: coenzyme F430 synthase [Methanomicrobium sp.]|nr:coenzyme F430 synthase [Methanomicrobium sp.]